MSYRDENEALHARVESLEADLAASRRALDAARAGRPPTRSKPGRALVPGAVAGVVAVTGAAVVIATVREETVAPPARVLAQPRIEARPLPLPSPAVVTRRPTAPPVPHDDDAVRWTATVRAVTGRATPSVGAACVIRADSRLGSYLPGPDALSIQCGDEVLYRWQDPVVDGLETRTCRVAEEAAIATETVPERGDWRYRMRCDDVGARAGGRPQLHLDTSARSARVFHTGSAAMSVDLDVEALSSVRTGHPRQTALSRPGPTFSQPLDRVGRVTQVDGAARTRVGAECTVHITSRPYEHENCRVMVRCANQTLYGAGTSGNAACSVRDDRPVSARDTRGTPQDGDPGLDLDLAAGTLGLVDEVDHRAWSVAIALRPR